MALKTVKLASILIGERFRKDMGDIELLVESLKEKGMIQPVTLDSNLNLLAGGRRCAAAALAGLDKIPALIRESEGPIDDLEIELIENVVRKDMTFSERALLTKRIVEMTHQKEGDGKSKTADMLDKSRGWITRQLQIADAIEAIPELANCKDEAEVIKKIKKAEEDIVVNELRSRQQEKIERSHDSDYLKLAGSHFNVMDTFTMFQDLEELQQEIPGAGTFDVIEVDPPYGIELNTTKKGDASDELERYTEVSPEEYPAFLKKLCDGLYNAASENAWVIFWYGPTWHTEVFTALSRAGFEVDDIPAIWNKGSGQTNAPDYYLARAYEPFAIARKGSPKIKKRGRSNVFDFNPVPPTEKYHPTQRPLPLMLEVLSCFAYPGAKILIPFLGSGVSLRACYALGYNGTGADLDSKNRDRFLLQVEKDIAAGMYGSQEKGEK